MTKVAARLGLILVNQYGLVRLIDPAPDIILLPHSQLACTLDRPYRAIRLIRDPRDIWVSGYLYHQRCTEEWCLNSELDATPPIRWPKVDHSIEHWPEPRKQRYIHGLGGKSYQRNLLDRSLPDGLDFELDRYTGWTLEAMREWKLNGVDALDVKLEHLAADFDATMRRIFTHLQFSAKQIETAIDAACSEDVRRMDDAAIARRPQITSRTISRWCEFLPASQAARFEDSYGDLIRGLGYPPTNAIAVGAADANGGLTDRWAPLLSADDILIHPTVVGSGVYTFVVPPGRALIRLEPRQGISAAVRSGAIGVRVSEIAIRSDAGEVVIAADDPRLSTGWRGAEQVGTAFWRWTDGSALLPWAGVSGPAVVTVRCRH